LISHIHIASIVLKISSTPSNLNFKQNVRSIISSYCFSRCSSCNSFWSLLWWILALLQLWLSLSILVWWIWLPVFWSLNIYCKTWRICVCVISNEIFGDDHRITIGLWWYVHMHKRRSVIHIFNYLLICIL